LMVTRLRSPFSKPSQRESETRKRKKRLETTTPRTLRARKHPKRTSLTEQRE